MDSGMNDTRAARLFFMVSHADTWILAVCKLKGENHAAGNLSMGNFFKEKK